MLPGGVVIEEYAGHKVFRMSNIEIRRNFKKILPAVDGGCEASVEAFKPGEELYEGLLIELKDPPQDRYELYLRIRTQGRREFFLERVLSMECPNTFEEVA